MNYSNHLRQKVTLMGLRQRIIINEHERGLLYRNGRYQRILEPGPYHFWRWENVQIARISTRQNSLIISGQEMLTADRIEVRVTLLAHYKITDPQLAISAVEDYTMQLYQDLQLALREAVATHSLDELLEDRGHLSGEVIDAVRETALAYGITLGRAGVRDIILPKAMRDAMMKEIEADRTGRAELVRARHEVAVARARANTAKIMAESPQIARLHELDALVAMADKPGNVILLPELANLFTKRD